MPDPTPKITPEAVEAAARAETLRQKVVEAIEGGGYVDAGETEDVARETLALLDELPAIRSSILSELGLDPQRLEDAAKSLEAAEAPPAEGGPLGASSASTATSPTCAILRRRSGRPWTPWPRKGGKR